MAQEDQAPRTLTAHFDTSTPSEYTSRWNTCWEEKWTPWDRGGPSWALYDLLKEKPELFSFPNETVKKMALVPGCGTGHDVLLLSSFGFDVCGLDLSPKASEAAEKHAQGALASGLYEPQSGRRGAITWLSGDFFGDGWLEKTDVGGKFDLVFDYTFFCALPTSQRPAWARRMADLLAADGRLVCLEFPSEKSPAEPGPPWASPPHAYEAYLSAPGESVSMDKHGGALPVQSSSMRSDGLKRLVHLKPRRTHAAGTKDGRVQDCISVWSH